MEVLVWSQVASMKAVCPLYFKPSGIQFWDEPFFLKVRRICLFICIDRASCYCLAYLRNCAPLTGVVLKNAVGYQGSGTARLSAGWSYGSDEMVRSRWSLLVWLAPAGALVRAGIGSVLSSLALRVGMASLALRVGVASLALRVGVASLALRVGVASLARRVGVASLARRVGVASLALRVGVASLALRVGVASLALRVGVASLAFRVDVVGHGGAGGLELGRAGGFGQQSGGIPKLGVLMGGLGWDVSDVWV